MTDDSFAAGITHSRSVNLGLSNAGPPNARFDHFEKRFSSHLRRDHGKKTSS